MSNNHFLSHLEEQGISAKLASPEKRGLPLKQQLMYHHLFILNAMPAENNGQENGFYFQRGQLIQSFLAEETGYLKKISILLQRNVCDEAPTLFVNVYDRLSNELIGKSMILYENLSYHGLNWMDVTFNQRVPVVAGQTYIVGIRTSNRSAYSFGIDRFYQGSLYNRDKTLYNDIPIKTYIDPDPSVNHDPANENERIPVVEATPSNTEHFQANMEDLMNTVQDAAILANLSKSFNNGSGQYSITYTLTDNAGNTTTVTKTIEVHDHTGKEVT